MYHALAQQRLANANEQGSRRVEFRLGFLALVSPCYAAEDENCS